MSDALELSCTCDEVRAVDGDDDENSDDGSDDGSWEGDWLGPNDGDITGECSGDVVEDGGFVDSALGR